MNDDTIRRVEAWFDGEVSAAECAEIEALLERDPVAKAYVQRLSRLREALNQAHPHTGTTGMAWHRCESRLHRAEEARQARVLTLPQLIAAAAAVTALGMAIWWPLRSRGQQDNNFLASAVQFVETDIEGGIPIVYLDQKSGWTVVWVIEP